MHQNPTPASGNIIRLTVSLARPRTWVFAMASYLFAYTASSGSSLIHAVIGCILFGILTAATNLINAHTDRDEDTTNNPQRITWLHQIGRNNVIATILILYSASLLLAIPFSPLFIIITAFAIFDSIFYSLPPLRFKRHPVSALLAFSAAVGLPFLAGLEAANRFDLFNPLFISLTYFMLAYGAVKNIPDYQGDRDAGLKTTATIFSSMRKAVLANTVLSLSPFVLILGLIAGGLLGTIYILNLVLLAFPIYFSITNYQANAKAVYERVHTLNFLYAVLFIVFNYLLTFQSIISLTVSATMFAFIFLATKLKFDSRSEESRVLASGVLFRKKAER